MWCLVQQREVKGRVSILDIDYSVKEIVPELPEHHAEGLIFDYSENNLGSVISYARKKIIVESFTEMDKQLTGEAKGNHAVVVRSVMNLEGACYSDYTESRHHLNKFKSVESARCHKL